jgi:hypothetical protein
MPARQSGAPEVALRQRLGHQGALDTTAGLYKSDHSRLRDAVVALRYEELLLEVAPLPLVSRRSGRRWPIT